MWQLQRLLQRLLTLNFVGVSAPPQMKIYIKTAEIVQVDNMFLGEKIIDEQHIHYSNYLRGIVGTAKGFYA